MYLLFLLCFLNLSQAEQVFIADLDDIVIHSHSTEWFESKLSPLKERVLFPSSVELFKSLEKKSKVYFLSTSLIGFKNKNKDLLQDLNLTKASLYQQSWPLDWSDYDFKYNAIKEIMDNHSPDTKFILILTNKSTNLELLKNFRNDSRISRVYVKLLFDKAPNSKYEFFLTPFEIAKSELHFLNLTAKDVQTIGAAFLKEKDLDKNFPSYAICPESYYPCTNVKQDEFELCMKVKKKIEWACEK